MAQHQWPPHVHPVLVREAASVLATEGLGAGIRGVDSGIPESADGEYQYTGVGHSVRERGADNFDGGDSGVEAGHAAEGEREGAGGADEDGSGGWEREGTEEGAVNFMVLLKATDMFLILLTQDLSWLALWILQHEVRKPLGRGWLCLIWACLFDFE
ncbi:hypothetical protein MMC27_002996 [Xylographa pallens]|nr:hypothetical protein [Xylographa pallens]